MTGSNADLINYRIDRSLETLKEANVLIQNAFWNASMNRIYYACYYAVSALLLKANIDSNSHKGIRQMFGLHYIQKGLVSKDDGRLFSDLYDKRQTGDYDDFINYEEDTVKIYFKEAQGFIQRIIVLAKQL
ncbi:MAG: HEPN domain-containing protein [Paludibacter sp.]|nr:HEPN domain-containing protein [Paludibacter sp.]